jgi:SP family galactose:H+ symporter-like MFS transporter
MTSATAAKRSTGHFISLVAGLAGLLFGLDIGVISGALPLIASQYMLSDTAQEWVVSSMMVGAAAGALGAGWFSWRVGRRGALVAAAALYIVGACASALAQGLETLIAARVVLGLAVGMASTIAPLYLSEMAPTRLRGAMICTYQLMITVGILAAFISDLWLHDFAGWRWMLGIIGGPALLFLLTVLVLPDSPQWLIQRGRDAEARRVLRRLHGDTAQPVPQVRNVPEPGAQRGACWKLVFQSSALRRTVALGVTLQFFQQFTGINVIMYYAPRVFDLAGLGSQNTQLWATCVVGLVNVLATIVAVVLADRCARRPVLLGGCIAMALSMGCLALLMSTASRSALVQFGAVASVLVFVCSFAVSAGPLVWALCAEIHPARGREFGVAVCTFVNWIANVAVSATFLTMVSALGESGSFMIYAIVNVAFGCCVFRYMPETKGVSLELLERNLVAGRRLRELGQVD